MREAENLEYYSAAKNLNIQFERKSKIGGGNTNFLEIILLFTLLTMKKY